MCDAKLYTSDLPEKVILKTLDDMQLRNTQYGLLICSQDTKTGSFDLMYRQQKTKCLKLLKLRQDKPSGPHRDNHDEYMPAYLTQTNQILV